MHIIEHPVIKFTFYLRILLATFRMKMLVVEKIRKIFCKTNTFFNW